MQRGRAEQISYELLAPYFQENLDVVASKVGLSKTALKAAMKKLGIDKWPAGNGTPRRQTQTQKENDSASTFPGAAPGNFMLPHSSAPGALPSSNGYHPTSAAPFSAQNYPVYNFGRFPGAGLHTSDGNPSSNPSALYSQVSSFGSFSARPTPPGASSAHLSRGQADSSQGELTMPTNVNPPNHSDLEALLALTSKAGATANLNIGAAAWTVDSEDLQFLFKVATRYRYCSTQNPRSCSTRNTRPLYPKLRENPARFIR